MSEFAPGTRVKCVRNISAPEWDAVGTTGVVVADRPDVPGSAESSDVHIRMDDDGRYATFHPSELEVVAEPDVTVNADGQVKFKTVHGDSTTCVYGNVGPDGKPSEPVFQAGDFTKCYRGNAVRLPNSDSESDETIVTGDCFTQVWMRVDGTIVFKDEDGDYAIIDVKKMIDVLSSSRVLWEQAQTAWNREHPDDEAKDNVFRRTTSF
jgi:hypothetical protein